MRDFQKTLTRFTEILQKRKVFTKLGIPSRDPQNFDLDYVLSLAIRISERRDTDEETLICKRFVRKICQKTTKHKNVLSGLIGLAPSDIYGSVISGGFTLILAASRSSPSLSGPSAHYLSSRLLRDMKNSASKCKELWQAFQETSLKLASSLIFKSNEISFINVQTKSWWQRFMSWSELLKSYRGRGKVSLGMR